MPRKQRSPVSHRAAESRDLTDKEARLVALLVAHASDGKTLSRGEAGKLAGYGDGETARVQASRALSRPAVRGALIEALKEAAVADASAAYSALRHVTDRAASSRDRIAAARTTLEMAGLVGAAPGTSGPPVTLHFHLSSQHARMIDAAPRVPVDTHPIIEGIE